jgi:predicted RNase H-like nuclease (RuvC/YqgF family)
MRTELEQEIHTLKFNINRDEERIAKWKEELKMLESCKEVDLSFLLNEIKNPKSEFLKATKKQKEYMHILGGDGRSQPWDEKRKGLALEIETKNIFIPKGVYDLFVQAVFYEQSDLKLININKQQFVRK